MKSRESRIADKVKKINILKAQISELDYFIETIDVVPEGYKHVKLGILVETERVKSIKIIANRDYVIGHLESEIKIPKQLIPDITGWARDRRDKLDKELESMLR